jgi:hypothetical protein
MAKTATQLEAELRKLTGDGETILYRRIELAATLGKDDSWLANHDGSLDVAQDYLQVKYFADLKGFIGLSTLVAMFETVPKAEWEKYKFDLAAIETIYLEKTASTEKTPRDRVSWKASAEEATEKLSLASAQLATSKRLEDAQATELTGLRKENEELRHDVAVLTGRIKELERFALPAHGVA